MLNLAISIRTQSIVSSATETHTKRVRIYRWQTRRWPTRCGGRVGGGAGGVDYSRD